MYFVVVVFGICNLAVGLLLSAYHFGVPEMISTMLPEA
jgi:hypothetical protein